MKKPTRKWKKWHAVRARNEQKRASGFQRSPTLQQIKSRSGRTKCTAWQGDKFFEVICTQGPTFPPSVICLDAAPTETTRFFRDLRARLGVREEGGQFKKKVWIRDVRGQPRVRTFYDFAHIEGISTSSAVVMAAEYDNARRLLRKAPPTFNLHEWSDAAFRTLFEIGFFEVVGITEATPMQRYRESEDGHTRIMQMISGENSNELEQTSKAILNLCAESDIELDVEVEEALNSALGEAMINVAGHAYPLEFIPDSVRTKRWWATASLSYTERSLNVVLYDQGATIPWTLPRKDFWPSARDRFLKFLGADASGNTRDYEYIEFALKEGVTSTERPSQGKGLPQMKDLIDICGGGNLKIYSRSGVCEYSHGNRITTRSLPMALDGTLVQWELAL